MAPRKDEHLLKYRLLSLFRSNVSQTAYSAQWYSMSHSYTQAGTHDGCGGLLYSTNRPVWWHWQSNSTWLFIQWVEFLLLTFAAELYILGSFVHKVLLGLMCCWFCGPQWLWHRCVLYQTWLYSGCWLYKITEMMFFFSIEQHRHYSVPFISILLRWRQKP